MHLHSTAFHHHMAFPLDTTGFNGVLGWAWHVDLGIFEAFCFSLTLDPPHEPKRSAI